MTTPDSSAVRAWAKENGYEVAGRGRLPAEVTDAYLAAHGGPGRTAARKTPAKKAAPVKGSAARNGRAAGTKTPAPAKSPAEVAVAPQAPEPASPGPKPSLVTDDRRLVALGEEIKALTARVEALEKAAGSKSSGSKTRFRLRSS